MRKELTVTRDRHWISPYFFSVFVALTEKRLDFDVEGIDLGAGAQRAPEYAQASVTARVPALYHRTDGGEFVLAESSAIVEYVEDTFPPPEHVAVLPTEPHDKARARQLMAWIRSDDTLPIREHRSSHTMFYERAKGLLPDTAKPAADKLVAVASRVIAKPEAYLFGAFSIADADLAFVLMRLVVNGDPVPAGVRAWAEHVWKRPSVEAFVRVKRPEFVPY
jgi:glutathione S-transferase